jgi:hypothetical protein
MNERLTEMQERVQKARAALEGLADRATGLRRRLEAMRRQEPPFASLAGANGREGRAGAVNGEDPHGGSPGDPFMPVGPSALAVSLERLTDTMRVPTLTAAELGEGDDGRFVSDAWEIALINEEGK